MGSEHAQGGAGAMPSEVAGVPMVPLPAGAPARLASLPNGAAEHGPVCQEILNDLKEGVPHQKEAPGSPALPGAPARTSNVSDFLRRASSGFNRAGSRTSNGVTGPDEPGQSLATADDSLHRALSGSAVPLQRSLTVTAMSREQDSLAHYVATPSGGLESLDYDEAEHFIVKDRFHLSARERQSQHLREQAITWAMVITAGFLTGCACYFSTFLIVTLGGWKFEAVERQLNRGKYFEGWLVLSGFVIGLSAVAVGLTRWAPEAAGSGIPHVKAYLNGNKLDGALRPRTLIAKVLGISCCVVAGMPAGREGPMVHTGAIIANLVGTGGSRWLRKMFKVRVRRWMLDVGVCISVCVRPPSLSSFPARDSPSALTHCCLPLPLSRRWTSPTISTAATSSQWAQPRASPPPSTHRLAAFFSASRRFRPFGTTTSPFTPSSW